MSQVHDELVLIADPDSTSRDWFEARLAETDLSSLAAAGSALYEANPCASCHEADRAEAGVVVKELEGLSARYGVESLSDFFTSPTPPMPVSAPSNIFSSMIWTPRQSGAPWRPPALPCR